MQIKRTCANCLKGRSININNDILCIEKGVVSSDYVCFKHRFMPAIKLFKPQAHTCKDCDYFVSFDSENCEDQVIGICQLFTVRKYDGKSRKACSRFIEKSKKEVS